MHLRRFLPYGLMAGLVTASALGAACGGDDDAGSIGDDAPGTIPSEGGLTDQTTPPKVVVAAPGPTRGSAIAISPDDSTLLVANRDVGTVSVFSVTFTADNATLAKTAEVAVGAEPWQVAISSDGTTGYVVVRKDQKLVEITGLNTAPAKGRETVVGSEPTGLALTPTSKTAWVANWVDGTVQGVDTESMTAKAPVDLNATLAASGMLGAGVTARPALAHPRSIAITNNGDLVDDDETMLVTEYFAQRKEALAGDFSNGDSARQGVVYKIKLADKSASIVTLAPIANISATVAGAGCYPNQLQSVTINGGFAFVSSVCVSPKGPLSPLANTHGAVSVLDIASGAETATGTASWNQKLEKLYTDKAVADDATRRYPALPSDMAFVPGKSVGYLSANGADALFRGLYTNGALTDVTAGDGKPRFVNLSAADAPAAKAGKNPIGVATPNQATHEAFAFVTNDASRNVSVVDFQAQAVKGAPDGNVVQSSALPTDPAKIAELNGKRFFNTGLGRWSRNGQAWGACASCHIDGLTDNVTWQFGRGPRQSVSLDGSFSKNGKQRVFNWTGIFDEVADFEGNTRTVAGGIGAIVKDKALDFATPANVQLSTDAAGDSFTGLDGSSLDLSDPAKGNGSVLTDQKDITAWVKSLRSPRRPSVLDAAKVAAGKATFAAQRCNGCHGGENWTSGTLFYLPTKGNTDALNATAYVPPAPADFPAAFLPAATNFKLRSDVGNKATLDQIQCVLRSVGTFGVEPIEKFVGISETRTNGTGAQGNEAEGKGYNPPPLFGMSVAGPFLHAGQAATLDAVFDSAYAAHWGIIDPNFLQGLDAAGRAAKVSELVSYVLTIDDDTEVVAAPASGALSAGLCPATFP